MVHIAHPIAGTEDFDTTRLKVARQWMVIDHPLPSCCCCCCGGWCSKAHHRYSEHTAAATAVSAATIIVKPDFAVVVGQYAVAIVVGAAAAVGQHFDTVVAEAAAHQFFCIRVIFMWEEISHLVSLASSSSRPTSLVRTASACSPPK